MIDSLNIDVNDRSIQTVEVRGPGHEITIIEIRQGPAGADGSGGGGSSAITTETTTTLTGFLRGIGGNIGVVESSLGGNGVEDTGKLAMFMDDGGLRASVQVGEAHIGISLGGANLLNGGVEGAFWAIPNPVVTTDRIYTLPDATGTVLLDTTLASTLAEAPLPIASGGTGSGTASAARINLRVPASDAAGIVGANAINNIVSITPNNYANMTVRDPNTIYIVTEL